MRLLKVVCFTILNIELIVMAWVVWCLTVRPKEHESLSCAGPWRD